MITVRPNPGKATRPPPPIPPRPSKTIVAEALAKTRKLPPQPNHTHVIVKSQSYSALNNYSRIVKIDDNSDANNEGVLFAEDPVKANVKTRTLVYQSSNSRNQVRSDCVKDSDGKSGNVAEIKVNIGRSASLKRCTGPSNRISSFKSYTNNEQLGGNHSPTNSGVELRKNQLSKSINQINEQFISKCVNDESIDCNRKEFIFNKCAEDESIDCNISEELKRNNYKNYGNQLKRVDSSKFKRSEFENTCQAEKLLNKNNQLIEELKKSPDESVINNKLKQSNDCDENWCDDINDRNHVNTLIDEMFASVLELQNEKTGIVEVFNEEIAGGNFRNQVFNVCREKDLNKREDCKDGVDLQKTVVVDVVNDDPVRVLQENPEPTRVFQKNSEPMRENSEAIRIFKEYPEQMRFMQDNRKEMNVNSEKTRVYQKNSEPTQENSQPIRENSEKILILQENPEQKRVLQEKSKPLRVLQENPARYEMNQGNSKPCLELNSQPIEMNPTHENLQTLRVVNKLNHFSKPKSSKDVEIDQSNETVTCNNDKHSNNQQAGSFYRTSIHQQGTNDAIQRSSFDEDCLNQRITNKDNCNSLIQPNSNDLSQNTVSDQRNGNDSVLQNSNFDQRNSNSLIQKSVYGQRNSNDFTHNATFEQRNADDFIQKRIYNKENSNGLNQNRVADQRNSIYNQENSNELNQNSVADQRNSNDMVQNAVFHQRNRNDSIIQNANFDQRNSNDLIQKSMHNQRSSNELIQNSIVDQRNSNMIQNTNFDERNGNEIHQRNSNDSMNQNTNSDQRNSNDLIQKRIYNQGNSNELIQTCIFDQRKSNELIQNSIVRSNDMVQKPVFHERNSNDSINQNTISEQRNSNDLIENSIFDQGNSNEVATFDQRNSNDLTIQNTVFDQRNSSDLIQNSNSNDSIQHAVFDQRSSNDLSQKNEINNSSSLHGIKLEQNNPNQPKEAAPNENQNSDDFQKTVLVIDENTAKSVRFADVRRSKSSSSTSERKKKIDDKFNHELLISELAGMKRDQEEKVSTKRDRERILKRQRKPSLDIYECESKIHTSDWVEVNDGQEIRLSSCQITIENGYNDMSNLHGLPPLPKSLSGFNLIESGPQTPGRPGSSSSRNASPAGYAAPAPNGELVVGGSLKKGGNLESKLALLQREMYSLRQLDLSLLSQLWSLNESIQDFRHMLQEQDERNVMSPPSPTPSSGEDAYVYEYMTPPYPLRFRPAPPPPPHRRPSNSSTGTGSSV